MTQLDLFGTLPNEQRHRYWRKRLSDWPREVLESRHHIHTSGWGMAAQGGWFADLLHRDGAMGELEYIRWQSFERRVKRWEQNKLMKETK
jgi:hypothetical protein